MAKTILIDAANAVHAIFGPLNQHSRSAWDQEAAHFVAAVQDWANGQPKIEVEIVFDGGFRKLSSQTAPDNVRVTFSDHRSADSLILERLTALHFYGKNTLVVTQDRALAETAQDNAARISSPHEFWDHVRRRPTLR